MPYSFSTFSTLAVPSGRKQPTVTLLVHIMPVFRLFPGPYAMCTFRVQLWMYSIWRNLRHVALVQHLWDIRGRNRPERHEVGTHLGFCWLNCYYQPPYR